MPSIRIVTDSTSDLPAEAARQYGITVVPNYINIGQKSYLEGSELPRQEFYEKLPSFGVFPQTSGPGVESYLQAYNRLAAEGATQILSIHVAAAFSSIFNTAQVAAAAARLPVQVVDSQSLSLGLGFQVLAAARAAEAGGSLAEITALLKEKARRTFIFAALDTVEYLRRSGRASRIEAGLAAFLHIFPVVQVYLSEVSLERIRTRSRSLERLVQHLEELSPLEEVAILHTHTLQKAEALRQRITPLLPPGLPVWTEMVTPAIGSHVGPQAVGLVLVKA
jgi:DegV family protein with EDD domain